ncbi:MAG: hypothetical protein WBB67_02170 [bacterium]
MKISYFVLITLIIQFALNGITHMFPKRALVFRLVITTSIIAIVFLSTFLFSGLLNITSYDFLVFLIVNLIIGFVGSIVSGIVILKKKRKSNEDGRTCETAEEDN